MCETYACQLIEIMMSIFSEPGCAENEPGLENSRLSYKGFE